MFGQGGMGGGVVSPLAQQLVQRAMGGGMPHAGGMGKPAMPHMNPIAKMPHLGVQAGSAGKLQPFRRPLAPALRPQALMPRL